ncbi:MAG: BC10 family protein [Bacteroidaceae bacterium]|nr:BC10 family protein [Bacteroidaceae bacterium]
MIVCLFLTKSKLHMLLFLLGNTILRNPCHHQ